jgi:hypothetical protein
VSVSPIGIAHTCYITIDRYGVGTNHAQLVCCDASFWKEAMAGTAKPIFRLARQQQQQ